MSFLNSINVSSSGLTAERIRMDLISQNITNANTTRTEEGGPYKRKTLVVSENKFSDILNSKLSGVKVDKIAEDNTGFTKVHDPSNPDADEDGYVMMPNVNIVEEMVNMITASRAYEANITAMNTTKSMALKAINIGK